MTATLGIRSPYRGLASFGATELDGLLFFGRERETEVTTANLLASRLTVLYGPSGVGKSSLLQAGVARRVRELGARRAVGRGPDLACVVFGSWADQPVARLGDAIREAVAPLVSPTALAPPAGARLADVAEHWSEVLDGELCIVLDQLEEYFVYHEHDAGSDSLLTQLPELVTRPGLRANVLLSVREDELARLGALKDRVPNVFANARRLDRLDRNSARAAIVGPLERWNELEDGEPIEIEPELVDAVLDETAVVARPGRVEAPYLQLVMERVWENETDAGSRVLRVSTLRELGGAEAIVRAHLDRALDVLDPVQQDAAARMFEHLVTPSGTKIAHRASDLAAFARVDEARGRDVLESLGRERILRPVEDDRGGGRYEIFHDVLAQAVLEWSRRRELDSERRLAKRRQRRLLALAAAALAAVVVMIVVTVYALGQRSDAQAHALAADALAALVTDPHRGLQLADDAARERSSPAAEQVLRTALLTDRARVVLRGNRRGVLAVGISHGRVLSIDGAGSLLTYTERPGGPVSRRPLGGRVRAAAIALRGSALVVARRRLVEVRGLDPHIASFAFRAPAPVRTVAIDGRGDRVAVATIDGRIVVRDAHRRLFRGRAPWKASSLALDDKGRVLAAAAGHRSQAWRVGGRRVIARALDRSAVTGVAVAPDGASYVTASSDGAARVRELPGGALTNVLVTGAQLTGVDFSPSGSVVVTRDRSGTSRVLSTADGHVDAVLAGHADAVTAAAFSPDSGRLVTGSADNTLRIWDPGVAPELKPVAAPAGCCSAFFVGANRAVAAAGKRALVFRSGRLVAVRVQPAAVTGVAFSGADVVTGGADGTVRVWRSPPLVLSAGARVTAVAANASRIVASLQGGAIDVWSSAGTKLATFHEQSAVDGLAISPDGRTFATAGMDDVARIRDLDTGRLLHELRRHTKAVTGVAFSPDGTTLATSSVDHDARLWDTRTGEMKRLLREHFAKVAGVAFSPDGRWLVTAGPFSAGLWQLPSGTFLFLYGHRAQIVGAGFGTDSRTVLTASLDGTIRSYRCEICGTLPELRRLADRRLAATR